MYKEIRNFLSYEIVLSVFDVILNTDYNFCPGPDCPVALSPGPNPCLIYIIYMDFLRPVQPRQPRKDLSILHRKHIKMATLPEKFLKILNIAYKC